MFELGLSGQMFDDRTVWDHLEAARRFGYRCVELRSTHVKPGLSQEELARVRSALEESGLYASCLSCFVGNYGLCSEEECGQAFETFRQYVELACSLGAEMIRVWPAWQESASAPEAVWERTAVWMKKSAQYAARFQKKLVMEMHHGTLCDSAPSALRLLRGIGEDNVGVTLDPVNLYQVPADYGEEAISALGKHLFNVHIKDVVQLRTGDYPYSFPYSYYARHIGRFARVIPPSPLARERYFCHRRINAGGVDWAHVLRSLKTHGYRGRLIVESVSETNRHMPSGMALAEACRQDIRDLVEALS
ncbi:MAG: sugar phosphate isomerase/epimerase family protein [Gemmatimonadota bacterium]